MRSLPLRRDTIVEAPPVTVEIDAGPSAPGWSVRVALLVGATGLAALALGLTGASPVLVWSLALAAGAVVVAFPTPPVPYLLVAAAGLLLLGADGPFVPAALALAALAHLTIRASWWAAHVPFRARVELAALVPDARRLLVIQSGTQALGAVAMLVAHGPGLPVAAAVGGVAILALTVVTLPRTD